MEEFFADPDRGYREVLDFIGVRDIPLSSYPKVNESKQVKNLWLLKTSRELPQRYPRAFRVVKRVANALGLRPGEALYRYTRSGNITNKSRPEISPAFRQELITEFRTDVERLEDILGRSLQDIWLKG